MVSHGEAVSCGGSRDLAQSSLLHLTTVRRWTKPFGSPKPLFFDISPQCPEIFVLGGPSPLQMKELRLKEGV